MFFAVFKTSLKTISRSFLLWITLILLIVVTMDVANGVNYSTSIVDSNHQVVEIIYDTDSRYVLDFNRYILTILNATRAWVMLYAMPLFCVVSTLILLHRSHYDGFYEIEKSSGIKSSSYCFGRILAIMTVNVVVCLIVTFLCFNYYYFSRGGIDSFSLNSYFIDSTVRILRLFVMAMFPGLLFYTGVTFVSGSILKSGMGGAIVGLGCVLLQYGSVTYLRNRLPIVYHDYLSPISDKLYKYWAHYDTEWFTDKLISNPFTDVQMITTITITISISFMAFLISYISVKRRII